MNQTPALTVSPSLKAEASSAHARINIPLNLENWKALPEEVRDELLWFHQHCLDQAINLKTAGEAIGYDESTVFRVLKGTYEGSWKNVVEAIRGYRRIDAERGGIQKAEFVENSITKMIWAGLDYAVANNSCTMIIGESRMGKSLSARTWRDFHNHGLSVLVTTPAYGGTKALLRRIAESVGVNKNFAIPQMHEAILRAFNRNRILIVDEAHRLLPSDRRVNPTNLEILRDLHDAKGCALALIATQRFDDELRKSHYQFEQLLGRIGLPVRLPRAIKDNDIFPIVQQYIKRPSGRLMQDCVAISNSLGRLGILVEIFKVASRFASKARRGICEEDFFKSIALRKQMMGELQFAKKED